MNGKKLMRGEVFDGVCIIGLFFKKNKSIILTFTRKVKYNQCLCNTKSLRKTQICLFVTSGTV